MAQKHRTAHKRRSKKRNGGMPTSKKSKPNPNPYAMVLYRPDPRLRLSALSGPNSGFGQMLTRKLFNRPSDLPPPRRGVNESMSAMMSSVATERLANDIYERAERLRATSFQSQNVAECRQKNQDAVELLKQAIDMGNLKARACLADMLLNGTTLGIGIEPDFKKVLALCHVPHARPDQVDPDCEGVLAHLLFKREYHIPGRQEEIRDAAEHSAAAGSKYGQLVVGLIELREGNTDLASQQFVLAAGHNCDQAQVALGELCLRATPPNEGEALRLFELAARQGNTHAFQLIANTHGKNAHDPESFREAVKWFTFCKDAGNQLAQHDLAELASTMYRQ